jgi:hypothetical protein
VAFVDIDHDGDQDVFAVLGGAYTGDAAHNVLFQNPGNDNHWLTLFLEGVVSNRDAIGARITVTTTTANGPRQETSVVSTGGSFGSDSLRQELGLGDATGIESLQIRWPSGRTQTFEDVAMDRFARIIEGGEPETIELPVLPLGGGS